MAKTKHIRLVSPEQGLTSYCSVTFIPSDPDIPSSYLGPHLAYKGLKPSLKHAIR